MPTFCRGPVFFKTQCSKISGCDVVQHIGQIRNCSRMWGTVLVVKTERQLCENLWQAPNGLDNNINDKICTFLFRRKVVLYKRLWRLTGR